MDQLQIEILNEINTGVDIDDWFPLEFGTWIKYHALKIGVPETYLAFPVLVAVAYLSQHGVASYTMENEETGEKIDFHSEPMILYGLGVGESGTNKTACLNLIAEIVDNIRNVNGVEHMYETGTLDGLMHAMLRNDGCAVSFFDELATFNDSLDKGSIGMCERSRFLTLFNGGKWQKTTKTSGDCCINNPRYSMFAFTQPYYVNKFAESNCENGFFPRFLLSIPPEKGVFIHEKKELLKASNSIIELRPLLASIYKRCSENAKKLIIAHDATHIYDQYHDEVVTFRLENKGEPFLRSVKSKSLGILLRLGGVMSLMRNACKTINSEEIPQYNDSINSEDLNRALQIVRYSVETCFSIVKVNKKIGITKNLIIGKNKEPVPEPENFTMDYIMCNAKITKRILKKPEISVSLITRDKIYPHSADGRHWSSHRS